MPLRNKKIGRQSNITDETRLSKNWIFSYFYSVSGTSFNEVEITGELLHVDEHYPQIGFSIILLLYIL